MPGYKTERTAEDIKRELIAILSELKDPRIAGKMLTIVKVLVSGDCSYAKVYVSDLSGMDGAKDAAKALNGAVGFIRGEIGKRLHLRKAPELKFYADDSIAKGIDIAKKLKDLTEQEASDEERQGN